MDGLVLTAVLGLYGGLLILAVILVLGFRRISDQDLMISERIALQMTESAGFMKEMARKTDEMARKTDEIAQANKDTGLFLRMIFERVDKNRS